MHNYLQAELVRIFSKKGLYIYFGIFLVLYILAVYMMSGSLSGDSYLMQVPMFNQMILLLGGVFLFGTIYNDDLAAKSLAVLIGRGMSRGTILAVKLIINALLGFILFIGGHLVLNMMYALFGVNLSSDVLTFGFQSTVAVILQYIAFTILTSLVVYGVQKATAAVVIFVLLASGFINQIITLLLGMIHLDTLLGYTLTNLSLDVALHFTIGGLLKFLVINMVLVVLSFVVFKKKDLEF